MKKLRIMGGGAVHGLVEALRPAFEAETGFTIEGTFGAVGAIRARLLAGEPADLVILSRALIEGLAHDRHLAATSMADLGTVETAVAARQGDAVPDVGDAKALRAALLQADAIHFPDPEQATAGIHFAKVLHQLGIWGVVASRLRTAPNGATAMRALAVSTSSHPIGCTQATEILSTPGLVLVGPLPPDCALATVYTAALNTKAEAPAEGARLAAMLTDEAGRETRRRLGFS